MGLRAGEEVLEHGGAALGPGFLVVAAIGIFVIEEAGAVLPALVQQSVSEEADVS